MRLIPHEWSVAAQLRWDHMENEKRKTSIKWNAVVEYYVRILNALHTYSVAGLQLHSASYPYLEC